MQRKIQEFKRPLEHTALVNHLSDFYTEFGCPGGSDSEEFACNPGDSGSVPELESSPGGGNGNSLQHSCLENPMDRGAWQATVQGGQKQSDMTQRLNNNNSNLTCYDAILNDIILKIYFLTVFLNCLFEKDN